MNEKENRNVTLVRCGLGFIYLLVTHRSAPADSVAAEDSELSLTHVNFTHCLIGVHSRPLTRPKIHHSNTK